MGEIHAQQRKPRIALALALGGSKVVSKATFATAIVCKSFLLALSVDLCATYESRIWLGAAEQCN